MSVPAENSGAVGEKAVDVVRLRSAGVIHLCPAPDPCGQCEENRAAADEGRHARNLAFPTLEDRLIAVEAKLDALIEGLKARGSL